MQPNIGYNKINMFLQKNAENEAGRQVPDLFFEVKASGL